MPINAHPEYFKAETEYLNAKRAEDKIYWTEEMIRLAPKHKGSENLLAGLRTRLKKLKESAEKARKKSGGKKGIKKEGFQFVLMGKTNKGKSSLLKCLTNAEPSIGDYDFTNRQPEVGTFQYEGVQAQIIDTPSIGCEQYDSGIVNNADCLLIIVENLQELEELKEFIGRNKGKKIVVVNKIDLLNEEEKIKRKRIDGLLVSAKTEDGIGALKNRMFMETGMIRIYLKEPGKQENRKKPLVLKEGAAIKDVGEHILKGFSGSV